MKLKDCVALVTGGTRGIGAATALALADSGADIAITGRQLNEDAKAVKRAVVEKQRRCVVLTGDISKPDVASDHVRQTLDQLGSLDVLVHSAGGPVNGGLMSLDPASWHAAFETHVHPIFYLCRAAIPVMQKKRQGVVILISSTAGIRGIQTNVAYQVVKGALPQFTRALAREFADDNIRVNCVAPGVIRTAFHAAMSEQQKKLNLEHRIPLHREGTPDQVATLILELVKNDYITGQTVVIDGGLTMRIV